MNGLKKITVAAAIASATLFANVASANVVYTVDTKLGQQTMAKSDEKAEIDQLKTYLSGGVELEEYFKYEGSFLNQTDAAGNYFIDLALAMYDSVPTDAPSYFILKFGTGSKDTAFDTYFFQNIAEMDKLVFTNAQVNGLGTKFKLSHLVVAGPNGDFPPDGTPIPEPASVALFGLGVMGLFLRRRSIKK